MAYMLTCRNCSHYTIPIDQGRVQRLGQGRLHGMVYMVQGRVQTLDYLGLLVMIRCCVDSVGNVGEAPVAGLTLRAALTRQRVLGWQGWQAQCLRHHQHVQMPLVLKLADPLGIFLCCSFAAVGQYMYVQLLLLLCSICVFSVASISSIVAPVSAGEGICVISGNLSGPCNDQSIKSIINCFQRHLSAKFCHHMHTGIVVYSSNSSACERCRAGWESWLGNNTKQTR